MGASTTTPNDLLIDSDSLELLDHGERTRFSGHVRLNQPPNELFADEMIQWRDSGLVKASQNIRGTWVQPDGSLIKMKAQNAQYAPEKEALEWWSQSELERWQVATDTAPLRMTADHFWYDMKGEHVVAQPNAKLSRGQEWQAVSEKAEFDVKSKRLVMSGQHGVWVDVNMPTLKGRFTGNELHAQQAPDMLSLIGRAKGRVQTQ
jgi:lipopolysaccharide export system protein LptA